MGRDGAWSVHLQHGGSHDDPIHSRGSMPPALCARLSPSIVAQTDDAGIRFVQPHHDPGPALAPLRVTRPQSGQLVLFSSCMWQGTVPFHVDAVRAAVAFDMLPADWGADTKRGRQRDVLPAPKPHTCLQDQKRTFTLPNTKRPACS